MRVQFVIVLLGLVLVGCSEDKKNDGANLRSRQIPIIDHLQFDVRATRPAIHGDYIIKGTLSFHDDEAPVEEMLILSPSFGSLNLGIPLPQLQSASNLPIEVPIAGTAKPGLLHINVQLVAVDGVGGDYQNYAVELAE